MIKVFYIIIIITFASCGLSKKEVCPAYHVKKLTNEY
jgi:hypothetical protein